MTPQSQQSPSAGGMSARLARSIEYAIIALCLVALVMIFQPLSITLFSIGAGLVVVAGLAFNLIPFAQPGLPLKGVVKAAIIVAVALGVVTALAIGAALLYGWYLNQA